jgi:hypothetical protein
MPNPIEWIDVDPRTLRVSSGRRYGADPAKLARQLSLFGASMTGMPAVEVWKCKDDVLMISNGVTRATRIAKLLPGQVIRVKVTARLPRYAVSWLPTIQDVLP